MIFDENKTATGRKIVHVLGTHTTKIVKKKVGVFFPTILGFGVPLFRNHFRQKKVYLYRDMRQLRGFISAFGTGASRAYHFFETMVDAQCCGRDEGGFTLYWLVAFQWLRVRVYHSFKSMSTTFSKKRQGALTGAATTVLAPLFVVRNSSAQAIDHAAMLLLLQ